MNVEEYVISKQRNSFNVKNYLQKQSVLNFNYLIGKLGLSLREQKIVHKLDVIGFIMNEFYVTETTAQNHFKKLLSSNIFVYDYKTQQFSLPQDITLQ